MSSNNDQITNILLVVLMFAIVILFGLVIFYIFLKLKNRKAANSQEEILGNDGKKVAKSKSRVASEYNVQSVFKFMEFESIQDNMIIQREGRRFLMVISCQGINYDLMSQMEKVGVEEGFQSFLNTLSHPIQIYVQTRTVNLEQSLATYRGKIKEIEDNLNSMKAQYEFMRKSDNYSQADIDKAYYELTKQTNLYEYGKDVIYNTETLSQNRNILNKNYYIIVPYFSEEAGDEKYDEEEVKSMAFSELYTKSQAIIRTLASTGVTGKILNSTELAELLYVAYNRDESETYNLQNAIRAGAEDIYTTGKDVLDKKIAALDQEIERKAFEKAQNAIDEAKVITQKEKDAKEKEDNMENLINMMTQMMLENNKQYIGEELTEKAKEVAKNTEEKGEEENVQTKTKRRTTRTKKN